MHIISNNLIHSFNNYLEDSNEVSPVVKNVLITAIEVAKKHSKNAMTRLSEKDHGIDAEELLAKIKLVSGDKGTIKVNDYLIGSGLTMNYSARPHKYENDSGLTIHFASNYDPLSPTHIFEMSKEQLHVS